MKPRRGKEKTVVCTRCGIQSVNVIGWHLYFISFESLKEVYQPMCPRCLKRLMESLFGDDA